MFTKLRNKFLILNMTIISIVMICSFVAIYFVTDSNMRRENQSKLASGSERVVVTNNVPVTDSVEYGKGVSYHHAATESFLLFTISVDNNGVIQSVDSIFDMSDDTYEHMASTAWNDNNGGTLTVDGRKWQYAVNQSSIMNVFEGSGQVTKTENDDYQIVFLDITESSRTLLELLITLLAVGSVMLIAVFVVSLYFSNRAIRPISGAWEKQRQFVADASHELKTPLSIITANYGALLANEDETIKSQSKWLDYIKIGTDRMEKLIDNLLSLARADELGAEAVRESFDISKHVHKAVLTMGTAMAEKNINLSLSVDPEAEAKIDSERFGQVVEILLDNAVKYTEQNGEITVRLEDSKQELVFAVRNSGKGISGQDLPKIFDRFYRADQSRSNESGGYGLGLSIAKTIVESLGGKISADSIENEYTVFRVSFAK